MKILCYFIPYLCVLCVFIWWCIIFMVLVLYIYYTMNLNNYHIHESWNLHRSPRDHNIILKAFLIFSNLFIISFINEMQNIISVYYRTKLYSISNKWNISNNAGIRRDTHSESGQYVSASSDSNTNNCAETKPDKKIISRNALNHVVKYIMCHLQVSIMKI